MGQNFEFDRLYTKLKNCLKVEQKYNSKKNNIKKLWRNIISISKLGGVYTEIICKDIASYVNSIKENSNNIEQYITNIKELSITNENLTQLIIAIGNVSPFLSRENFKLFLENVLVLCNKLITENNDIPIDIANALQRAYIDNDTDDGLHTELFEYFEGYVKEGKNDVAALVLMSSFTRKFEDSIVPRLYDYGIDYIRSSDQLKIITGCFVIERLPKTRDSFDSDTNFDVLTQTMLSDSPICRKWAYKAYKSFLSWYFLSSRYHVTKFLALHEKFSSNYDKLVIFYKVLSKYVRPEKDNNYYDDYDYEEDEEEDSVDSVVIQPILDFIIRMISIKKSKYDIGLSLMVAADLSWVKKTYIENCYIDCLNVARELIDMEEYFFFKSISLFYLALCRFFQRESREIIEQTLPSFMNFYDTDLLTLKEKIRITADIGEIVDESLIPKVLDFVQMSIPLSDDKDVKFLCATILSLKLKLDPQRANQLFLLLKDKLLLTSDVDTFKMVMKTINDLVDVNDIPQHDIQILTEKILTKNPKSFVQSSTLHIEDAALVKAFNFFKTYIKKYSINTAHLCHKLIELLPTETNDSLRVILPTLQVGIEHSALTLHDANTLSFRLKNYFDSYNIFEIPTQIDTLYMLFQKYPQTAVSPEKVIQSLGRLILYFQEIEYFFKHCLYSSVAHFVFYVYATNKSLVIDKELFRTLMDFFHQEKSFTGELLDNLLKIYEESSRVASLSKLIIVSFVDVLLTKKSEREILTIKVETLRSMKEILRRECMGNETLKQHVLEEFSDDAGQLRKVRAMLL